MESNPNNLRIAGVDRTLSILEAFLVSRTWRLSDLSRHLEMNKASVYRTLQALKVRGYIQQDEPGGLYSLGQSAALLGRAASRESQPNVEHRHLLRLAEQTGEVVLFYGLQGHRYVCIDRIYLDDRVPVTVEVGDTLGLHAGAGKSILAFQSDEFIRTVLSASLPRYSSLTIVDPDSVMNLLDTIRRQKYWVSKGEITPGTSGISAPVYSSGGIVKHALCLTVSSDRLSDDRLAYLLDRVMDAAASISQSYGYE